MKMRVAYVALTALLMLAAMVGAAVAATLLTTVAANAEPIVVIGTYSDAISAEAACKFLKESKTPVVGRAAGLAICDSVRDPKLLAGQMEGDIMNRLATNPRCKGVTVVSQMLNFNVDEPKFNPAMDELLRQNADYWELDVDYQPLAESYNWALWPKPTRNGVVLGEDTPARIAEKVCTVVTGHGAKIR